MKIHSAFSGNGYGICGEPLRISPQLPQPRRRRDEVNNLFPDCAGTPDPSPGKHYLLDTRLLMGGTHQPMQHLYLECFDVHRRKPPAVS
jgi:hypothetical protein